MSRKLKHKVKGALQLIAFTHPNLSISEQYRHIRTSIMYSSVDKVLKSIMITSPEPDDGKTTTACNLAVVLAQHGKQVVLVDADLRKPSIHIAFNSNNMNGLTSVLTKEISLTRAVLQTDIPNLEILTSGPIPPNPSELLDSNAMETVLEELKERFDYVIIDTPPVLAVTDAEIIGNKCDGIVLVVECGKTRKDRAMKAKGLLEKVKSQLLGVVVNGEETQKNEYYLEYK